MTLTQMNYIITISETGSLNKSCGGVVYFPAFSDQCSEGTGERAWNHYIQPHGRGVTLTNDGTEISDVCPSDIWTV